MLLRLAARSVGRRPAASVVVGFAVAAAAFTAQLALTVSSFAASPWDRTFAATRGAHVVVRAAGVVDLSAIREAPGVAEVGAIRPAVFGGLTVRGRHVSVLAEGMTRVEPSLDRPRVVDGSWNVAGGVVFERSFARALGVHVGDAVSLRGVSGVSVSLVVAGIAVTATQAPFPDAQPGLAFVSRASVARLAPALRREQILPLRLVDPASAPAFAEGLFGPGRLVAEPWQAMRANALASSKRDRIVLGVFSLLLLAATGAVVATLTGGRVLSELRRLATMRSLGFSPAQVTLLVAAEQAIVAAVGASAGIVAATIAEPAVAAQSEALLSTTAPSVRPLDGLAVVLASAAIAAATAFLTAAPTARRAVAAMRAAGHPRRPLAGRLLLGTPLPPAASLGVGSTFSRRGRAISLVVSLALTVATFVAVLAMESTLRAPAPAAPGRLPPIVPGTEAFAPAGDDTELRRLVYSLGAALLVVTLANLVATLLLTIAERRRSLAILRVAGLTPRQVSGGISLGYATVGFFSAVLGLPLGLLLFRGSYEAANGSLLGAHSPGAVALAAVVPCAALVVGSLAFVTVRRSARAVPAIGLRQP